MDALILSSLFKNLAFLNYKKYNLIIKDNNSTLRRCNILYTGHLHGMSIQRKVIHVYIIVVGAVLLTVYKFHDYILASKALFEFDSPFSVARH